MNIVKRVTLAGKEYPVCFSSNALYRLEEITGMTMDQIGMLLEHRRAGFRMLQLMLWAALEGGRLKTSEPNVPVFTVLAVGDLLDGTDSGPGDVWRAEDEKEGITVHPVMQGLMDAWVAAFPKLRKGSEPRPPQNLGNDTPGTSS